MTDTTPTEQQIAAEIAELDPRIELIAVEAPARETLRLFIDHPDGVGLELCENVTRQVRDLLADYALEVSSPGLDRPLTKPEHFRKFVGHKAQIRTERADRGPQELHRTLDRRGCGGDQHRVRRGRCRDSVRSRLPLEPCPRAVGGAVVSREIVDAIKVLEQEKGLDSETLMAALEDALLSAYKKTAGRGEVRTRRPRSRDRGLPRLRADPARRAGGEAARRGRRESGAGDRPGPAA